MAKINNLFFDVDGTLVNPRTIEVDDSTRDVLRQLKSAGHRLYIATGRSLGSLQPEVKELVDWDGYIFNNGQVVLDKQLNGISETLIDPQLMTEIINKAKALGIAMLLQGERWQLVTPPNHYVQEVFDDLNAKVLEVEPYQNEKVYTFIIFGHDYSLIDEYPNLRFAKGQGSYADIMLEGFNKAVGIEKMNIGDYIAFGDSMNDVEMFKKASISVAMSTAAAPLKTVATHQSETKDDEIATMVKALNLLD